MYTTETMLGDVNASKVNPAGENHTHPLQTSGETFISNEVTIILQWIIWSIIPQIIVVCGIAGNVINIICFVKEGFKDSVNVTFTVLAITDLGCLSTLIWTNICFTPGFYSLDLPFDTMEVQFMISGIPHATFARISSWITALIIIERCLCITMPLKVKDILTPKRVCITCIAIYIVLIVSVLPMYFIYKLGHKFYIGRNKSIIGIVYAGDRERFDSIYFPVNYFIIPFFSFVVIIVCTIILAIELSNKTKWRQTSTSSMKGDTISSANMKVAKMVVVISTLFIVCFIPSGIVSIAMAAVPEFSIDGKFRNILSIAGGFGFLLESINSSANIAIYYRMSSKFRDAFHQIFTCLRIHSSDTATIL